MAKLTLSVDPKVIAQAKRIADANGASVSSLFERFIRLLARRRRDGRRIGPITQAASGVIALPRGKSERDVLVDALVEKHEIRK
jgi:hypothetical protein